MSRIIFALLCLLTLTVVSCKSDPKKQMLEQLTVLKTAVLKKDKEAVSTFFSFPIKNDYLLMMINDQRNNKPALEQINKANFLKYYNYFITEEFINVLKKNDLQKLLTDSSLEVVVMPPSKTERCYKGYNISLELPQITLTHYSNHRNDIPPADEEESETDDYCEFATFWHFELKNNKLLFIGADMAG
ncbi:MAG: hypothetical protein QM731_08220 [Chitinophagaceae bacterium]